MMTSLFKTTPVFLLFVMTLFLATAVSAQSSKAKVVVENQSDPNCNKDNAMVNEVTSGCSPSSCKGSQTKFGEAKIITKLRKDLISLKAEMESYKSSKFEARTYDIHKIVGETDEQSLTIIIDEIKLIEKAFSAKFDYKPIAFSLPENKAKQVRYLEGRIKQLKKLL